MSFSERFCDAMDAHRERTKHDDLFPPDEPRPLCDCGSALHTHCTPPKPARPCDGGIIRDGHWTDCAYEAGHVGAHGVLS